MSQKEYMNIGEFAKISGISRRNLIFYDEIGLFSPAAIAENGYRCYTIEQFFTLDTINILKTVGMSLKEIKEFLENRTPQKAIELYFKQDQTLVEEIERLTYYHKVLQTRIWRMKYASALVLNTVMIDESPTELFLVSSKTSTNESAGMMKTYFDFFSLIKEQRLDIGYPMGGVVYSKDGFADQTKEYEYQMVQKITREQAQQYHDSEILIKPEGRYLTEFSSGDKYGAEILTDNMIHYIAEHHLETTGPAWEFWWIDDTVTQDLNQHIYQTCIQIKSPSPAV